MIKVLFLFLCLFPQLLNAQTITYSGINVGISSTAPGQALDVQGTVRASSGFSGYYPYVKISNTQTSGTSGGSTTFGSWQTCTFNTKDIDSGSIASLSSNQITLPAGTYYTHIIQLFQNSGGNQIRLQNITDSTTVFPGLSEQTQTTDATTSQSEIYGTFTISASKTFAIQYQVGAAKGTNGLGQAQSFGTEVYAVGEFTKIQ